MTVHENIFKFTHFEAFYEHFKPLTVYGNRFKSKREVYSDEKQLQLIFQTIGIIHHFSDDQPETIDKIEFHLKKISPLNSIEKEIFDSTDLFLFKRFLVNYKAICQLLSDEIKKALSVNFNLDDVLSLLLKDSNSNEGFYLNSNFDNRLKEVRIKIENVDADIQRIRTGVNVKNLESYKLDFTTVEFLIVEERNTRHHKVEDIFKEPYDTTCVLVKPVMPSEYFSKTEEREALITREVEIETDVLEHISKEIKWKQLEIERAIDTIRNIDVFLAKAKMIRSLQLSLPNLNSTNQTISLQGARFLYLEQKCTEKRMKYQTLDVNFDTKTIVVKGSNMGGKTVVLQTIGFLQLISQMGFWVPAKTFKSRTFKHIHFVGNEQNNDKIEGLSSFGEDIYQLTKVYETIEEPTLVLIDEFARTTNSTEAEALVTAILKLFAERQNVNAFLTTHFMRLQKVNNTSTYRMKGLNYELFVEQYHKKGNIDITERIKLLNQFIDYSIEKDNENKSDFDALKIGYSLGLDINIINTAFEQLRIKKHERPIA
jgi:DNA mismatch repair ATPase MutS